MRRKLEIYSGECVLKIERADNKQFKVISTNNHFLTDYVILCSGVIGTNLLFLKKCIGEIDDDYLHEHNVGMAIKDHSNVRVNVRSSKSFGSLNEISKLSKKILYFSQTSVRV